jgi:cytosine deaminase
MLIDRITDARLPSSADAHTLDLRDGRVARVALSGEQPQPGTELALNGKLLGPALVDAHVHLDKAFLLDTAGTCAPTLAAAIASVAALRGRLPISELRANAERAIEQLVKSGVTAARVHVEIEPAVGLDLLHLQQELAHAARDRIDLQLVAFPQLGLERPEMLGLMSAALSEGVSVVGGCPYVDSDPARHLDRVFELAERFARPIDLHLDFSDEPRRSLLSLVAERVRAHGVQGQVTIGHATTLAAMPVDAQAAALDLLAQAGIALVLLPATDLYLAGVGEPGTRSLAPLARARAAGVRVAIANNNLQNPFAPFGNANLAQAAWLAGVIGRAAEPTTRRWLLEAITSEPARVLGLPAHGPVTGAWAHFAVFDAAREEDIVLTAPAVLATLRAGRLVYCASSPEVRSG